jgi:drug/metabolite transporter (DMT)-like permease
MRARTTSSLSLGAIPSSDRRRGLAWAFASALGSALFVIPWKLANAAGDPAHSVLLLLGVAAFANSGLALWQRLAAGGLRLRSLRTDLGVAVLLASFTLLGNLASARAIRDLSPALLNVVLRAEVILVAVFAWMLLGERVERRFWLGAAVAAIGLVILQEPSQDLGGGARFGAGTTMALAAAACFSALAVITRRFIHRMDPVVVNSLRLWLSVALWFPFHEASRLREIPTEQIVYASLAAMAGPFFARLCLMISARYVEARVTTLASLTAPALTLVLAWVLLSDWPDGPQLLGGAIMIAGISIPLLWPRREGPV